MCHFDAWHLSYFRAPPCCTVNFHMPFQLTWNNVSHGTNVAFKSFISDMRFGVISQLCFWPESRLAWSTFVWFFTGVGLNMGVKIAFLVERSWTIFTFIWFFTSVNSEVDIRGTMTTLKWFISCVDFVVAYQIGFVGKSWWAFTAFKGFFAVVRIQVNDQTIFSYKCRCRHPIWRESQDSRHIGGP